MFCSPFNPLSQLARKDDLEIPLWINIEHSIEELCYGQGETNIMSKKIIEEFELRLEKSEIKLISKSTN